MAATSPRKVNKVCLKTVKKNLAPPEKHTSWARRRDPATRKEGHLVAPSRRNTASETSSSPAVAEALHSFRQCPT